MLKFTVERVGLVFGGLWCVLLRGLSGDGVRLSLCTEKQFKLYFLVATNRTAIVATIEQA
jgi:hypothetical protein